MITTGKIMTIGKYNLALLRALTLFAFFVSAPFGSRIFAQGAEAQVAKIRAVSSDTNRRIEAGLKDKTSGLHYAAWTIGGELDGQQWAAAGTMKTQNEFWFDGEPGFDEGKVADARKTVRKIVSTYAGAGELRLRAEYLFNPAGELIFAYTIEYTAGEDGSALEQRFYFARGKLIRRASGSINRDAKFSAEDLSRASEEQQAAKRLQNIFALAFSE